MELNEKEIADIEFEVDIYRKKLYEDKINENRKSKNDILPNKIGGN